MLKTTKKTSQTITKLCPSMAKNTTIITN